MTKRRLRHDPGGGRKAVVYGNAEGFGPMLNPRHSRKLKLAPMDKKTAHAAANNVGGKQTPQGT